MHGTTASLRTGAAARLADLERRKPEWQAWLTLLRQALELLGDVTSRVEGERSPSSDAPLLHGRVLVVDGSVLDRLGLLCGDRVDSGALETIARLAATVLLQSVAPRLQKDVPASWSHGYCPVCGSWPVLAELRSLDRTRLLRCGRCGSEWGQLANWLSCAFCGERDHERLRKLVLEGEPETLTVETCLECHGYLKSVTTLQPIPPFELLLQDLETVELDVAALERGFARPAGDGFALDLRVTAR
jgi:ribosomal protein S27AE